jgi:DNA-binding transcriptional ArsR family regulator
MKTTAPRLDSARMQDAAKQATAVLQVLANENRLLLLCQLSQGERSVTELEQMLDIRQPTLSQQLAVLRAEGLVETRRDGRRIFYSVADSRVLALLNILYDLYCPTPLTARR